VHKALRTVVDESYDEKLGDQLPRDALRLFLRAYLDEITSAEFHLHVVLDQMKVLVRYSRLSSECTPESPHQQALSTEDTSVTSADFRRIWLVIHSCLESFITYTDDELFIQHTSIYTLMNKLGN
jgi:hypothetical protein